MAFSSKLLERIKSSPSILISNKAMEMKRAGRDVIALSAGEPDFDTPDNIKMAAMRAIVDGHTKYPPLTGLMELREAICRKFSRENGLDYHPDQVIVSTGGKQVISNALIATLDPKDEVIIPAPYWVSYPDMALLGGGEPVVVETLAEDEFRLTPERLEAAINERTRWLILNSPGNPSGGVYSAEDLQGLAEVLRRHPRILILTDDIYEHIVYDGVTFSTMAAAAPDLADRTLTMNGLSKSYCMTGWRLGYAAGPKDLIRTMAKVQSQTTSGACGISQWAGVEALDGDQSFIARNVVVFRERRDLGVSILNQTRGLSCSPSKGAFYLYVDCRGAIGKRTPEGETIGSDGDFAQYLLKSEEVAAVHGEAFGLSPYFRISYALATDRLEEACIRIQRACTRLEG
ncbi:pyridoxal phosphate-dependent aminotransferase [Thioalkalivibrio sp. HK1]|uniref:pyridoxal phosphate-dependent aminotransferase n=1 Tax=Thioalkalivibrio sp. HK1 TaxID=1469245 RepID=UPI000472EDB7|nr:pyridoxal phosphate-dependent aminotransferase [Thioalkalivibrio sp. HK1]